MILFADLQPIQHTIVLIFLLLVLLIYIYILSITILRTKRWGVGLLVFLNLLIYYIVLSILVTYLYELKLGKEPSYITYSFANSPIWMYFLLILAGYLSEVFLLYKEKVYQRTIITKASIKESIDNLPAGLSMSSENGTIILANWQINRLVYILTGDNYVNSQTFWDRIMNGKLLEGNERWDRSLNPIIKASDGRTWSFSRKIIDLGGKPVVEIIAIDITDLNSLKAKLEKDNERLEEMGLRLERYTQDAIEVKTREERFATKMRIHDEMGYALLATRQYIKKRKWGLDIKIAAKEILDLWNSNIAVLLGFDETTKSTVLASFISAAEEIGVDVKIRGNLPEGENEIDLILQVSKECLTNSVRHARASELYIDVKEDDYRFKLVFSNNGIIPKSEIVEGGGLSALRKRIEEANGEMEIIHAPEFTLTMNIPKKIIKTESRE